jgi:hypothetical protein
MRYLPILLIALGSWPVQGADLKDPTKRPVVATATPAARAAAALPRVSAIFMSDARQVAIFNDQPVRVGDNVGRFRIEEITSAGVRYSAAGHFAFAPLAGHN